jgi:hypothetical protein
VYYVIYFFILHIGLEFWPVNYMLHCRGFNTQLVHFLGGTVPWHIVLRTQIIKAGFTVELCACFFMVVYKLNNSK